MRPQSEAEGRGSQSLGRVPKIDENTQTEEKMNHRQRLLESENHTGRAVGDLPNHQRRDVEDALVQALEDTHRDGSLNAIRDWLQRWAIRSGLLDYGTRDVLLASEPDTWLFVHMATCWNHRMFARWEHSANKLLQEFGFQPENIPRGDEALYV